MLKKFGVLNVTALAKCKGLSMQENYLTADQMATPMVVV